MTRRGERQSRFGRVFFQDLFSFDIAVEIDGAPGARPLAERPPILPHFITGSPGELKRRAFLFLVAIVNIPAGGQHHQVAQAGQGKAPVMDQTVDLTDLVHIKIGIEPVVGIFLPQGLDEPFFLIFPDAFLGEIYHPGDLINEKELSAIASTPALFVFSSGHKSLYKKIGIKNLT
jgi:hypothetical protein